MKILVPLLDREEYKPGDEGYAQIRFEKPVVARKGDRFVVRSYSPIFTIGGGVVLNAQPKRHKRFDKKILANLARIDQGDPSITILEFLEEQRFTPLTMDEIAKKLSISLEACKEYLDMLLKSKEVIRLGKKKFVTASNLTMLSKKITTILDAYFQENPYKLSIQTAHLRASIKPVCDPNLCKFAFDNMSEENLITIKNDTIVPVGHTVNLTAAQKKMKDDILKEFCELGSNPPTQKEVVEKYGKGSSDMLEYLVDSSELLCITDGVFFAPKVIEAVLEKVHATYLNDPSANIAISGFREILPNFSRKNIVILLDFFDRIGLVRRVDDGRVLNNLNAGNEYLAKQK